METLRVDLPTGGYPIHIGSRLLDRAELFQAFVGDRRVAVVTNPVVSTRYGARLMRTLTAAGSRPFLIEVDDGEAAKNWRSVERVIDRMVAARCDRQSIVIALGGGVTGDLAGFCAAIYQRGVAFIQVPTTLLAQVDSSVGGKTGINHPQAKNMIGAFHQPLAVIADVSTLRTLPDRELRAGLAEVIKHVLILDAGFLRRLEDDIGAALEREETALAAMVRRCCELKAGVVAKDERESGLRAILNFGHTFGHAIESAAGYGEWLHGEAVAVGMLMAGELSVLAAGLDNQSQSRIVRLVEQAGLPRRGPSISPARYLDLMRLDKKVAADRVRFVLLEKLGQAVVRSDVDEAAVRTAIETYS